MIGWVGFTWAALGFGVVGYVLGAMQQTARMRRVLKAQGRIRETKFGTVWQDGDPYP